MRTLQALKESFTKTGNSLPENNDILKLLFKNVEKVVDKTTNTTIEKAKKNNSKIFGAIISGFALIVGIIYYFKNKSKNNKPIAQPPDIIQRQYYQPQTNNANPFFVKTNYNVNKEIFKNFIKA